MRCLHSPVVSPQRHGARDGTNLRIGSYYKVKCNYHVLRSTTVVKINQCWQYYLLGVIKQPINPPSDHLAHEADRRYCWVNIITSVRSRLSKLRRIENMRFTNN